MDALPKNLISVTSLLLSLLLPACEKSKTNTEPLIRPVRVAHIESAGAKSRQTLAGVAHASQEMSLSFRVSGTLVSVDVSIGDEMEKGQIVAALDTKDALIEIQRARASVAKANAEFRSAVADFDRIKALYADGSGSRSELDAARAISDSARAMLSAEKKGLEMEKSKLADHKLSAPLPGAIAQVSVEVNENVQSGQSIAVLNAGDKAEVEVAVPERLIESIRKGATVKVAFDSMPGDVFEGIVSEVGVASAAGAVGFPVRVSLLKADKRIRAGMSALVTLQLGGSAVEKRIYAPVSSVLEDEKSQHYVMLAVAGESGFASVKRRDITTGEPSSWGIEVKDGLKGGEMVVIAGLGQITDGMKVRLLSRDQPAAAHKRLKPAEQDEAESHTIAPEPVEENSKDENK